MKKTALFLLMASPLFNAGCGSEDDIDGYVDIYLSDAHCEIAGRQVPYDQLPFSKISFVVDVTHADGQPYASRPLLYRFVETEAALPAYQDSLNRAETLYGNAGLGRTSQPLRVDRALFTARTETNEQGQLYASVNQEVRIRTEATHESESTTEQNGGARGGWLNLGILGFGAGSADSTGSTVTRSLFTAQTMEEGIPFTLPPRVYAGEAESQDRGNETFSTLSSQTTISLQAPWTRDLILGIRREAGGQSVFSRVLTQRLAENPTAACNTGLETSSPHRTTGLIGLVTGDRFFAFKFFDHLDREIDCETFVRMANELASCQHTYEATVREAIEAR